MNNSRLARQLADPAFQKKNARLLYLAIALLFSSIAMDAYNHFVVLPKVTTIYSGIYSKAEALTPVTDNERVLRTTAIEMAKQAEDASTQAMSSSSGRVSLWLLFGSGLLINTYILRKQFKELTSRGDAPNQAL